MRMDLINNRYVSFIHTSWNVNRTKINFAVSSWEMLFSGMPECSIYIFKKKKKKKLYGPYFSGWGSTASRLEPLRGGCLLFTTKFQETPGTQFIDLGRMKGWVNLGATHWFWTRDPWIGNPAPLPLGHMCSETPTNIDFAGSANDNTPYTYYSKIENVLDNLQGY